MLTSPDFVDRITILSLLKIELATFRFAFSEHNRYAIDLENYYIVLFLHYYKYFKLLSHFVASNSITIYKKLTLHTDFRYPTVSYSLRFFFFYRLHFGYFFCFAITSFRSLFPNTS